MHHSQLESQHSRQAPPAMLRLSPSLPTAARNLGREISPLGEVRELAHDARNLISALDLYCELLASPGVLAPGFEHYAEDLHRLAGSGVKLIEALARPRPRPVSCYPHRGRSLVIDQSSLSRRRLSARFSYIEDLPSELAALESPLRALAGADVRLEIECAPCAGRLALTSEDLLRILFNLVANAVEAMAATPAELRRSPFLRITAQRGGGASFAPGFRDGLSGRRALQDSESIVLSVRDNGPGIAPSHLEHIFDAGFSTRDSEEGDPSHGLGLAIVRQLVAEAGGTVRAVSSAGLGARFDLELPILQREEARPRPELAGPLLTRKIHELQQISAQNKKEA